MASKIKGISVEIGGDTTGLNKALSGVNKQLGSTQTELRTVERQLKFDPSNTVLLAQKQELLEKAIGDASEKLKTLESVQSQVEAQFKSGEIDGGAYREFQREVEKTKSQLDDLKNQKGAMSEINTGADNAKSSFENLRSTLQNVKTDLETVTSKAGSALATAGKVGVETVGTATKYAAQGFAAYTTAVAGAATAVAGLAIAQVSNLDAIDKQSQALGLSREAYQQWDYVLSQNGVDIDSFGTGMKSLLANMDAVTEGNATAISNFEKLGVTVTNADGSLRSQEDVLKDTVAAFQNMEDGADKTRLATELFGKQGQSLMPLLNGTAGSVDELMQKCEDLGMIVSDETIDAGVKFSDTLDSLKRSAMGIFNTFASTGILESFTSGMEEVTGGIQTLLTAYKTNGIEGLTAEIPNVVNNLVTKAVNFITTAAPAVIQGVLSVFSSLIQALAQNVPTMIDTLLPLLLDGFNGLVQSIIDVIPDLLPVLVDGAMQLFTGLLDGLNQVVEQLMPMFPELIQQITDILIENLPTIIAGGFQLLIGIITGITDCIPELINAVVELIPVITQALIDNLPKLVDAGLQLIVALATGLPQAIPALIKAIPDIVKAIIDTFAEVRWLDIGANIMEGIAGGLWEGITSLVDTVGDVCSSVWDNFCDFWGIHSPSRKMAGAGVNMAQGIGVGFGDEIDDVNAQMQKGIQSEFNVHTNLTGSATGSSFSAVSSAQPFNGILPDKWEINLSFTDTGTFAKAVFNPLDALMGNKIQLDDRGLA